MGLQAIRDRLQVLVEPPGQVDVVERGGALEPPPGQCAGLRPAQVEVLDRFCPDQLCDGRLEQRAGAGWGQVRQSGDKGVGVAGAAYRSADVQLVGQPGQVLPDGVAVQHLAVHGVAVRVRADFSEFADPVEETADRSDGRPGLALCHSGPLPVCVVAGAVLALRDDGASDLRASLCACVVLRHTDVCVCGGLLLAEGAFVVEAGHLRGTDEWLCLHLHPLRALVPRHERAVPQVLISAVVQKLAHSYITHTYVQNLSLYISHRKRAPPLHLCGGQALKVEGVDSA